MTRGTGLPLSGLRVLDLSDETTVQTGRFLADLGAIVVRIESANGDAIRRREPFVSSAQGLERSLSHMLFNAGKLSVGVDFDASETWDLIDRLTGHSDIVVAPLRKSSLARAYFDPPRFASTHPTVGLVDVVFRRDQPDVEATDLMAVAAGGLLYCNGYPDRAPDYPVGHLAFKQASIVATAAACALALGKQRSGQGGIVCISLEEAVMSTTIQAANQNLWRWMHAICQRAGTGGLTYPVLGADGRVALVPGSGANFETKDGKFVVFGMTPFTLERWHSFVQWAEELTGDVSLKGERWHSADVRSENREHVHAVMSALCRTLDRDELSSAGQARGLMIVPVNRVEDIAADEHLIERGCFPSVDHPMFDHPLKTVRSPFRSTAYDVTAWRAPLLGEHTFEVLQNMGGATAPEIERLRDMRVIRGLADSSPSRFSWTRPTGGPSVEKGPTAAFGGKLPLAGYRVIDFCWQAAGPLMTELLANLGADVVKVESSTRIDTVRLFSHPLEKFSIDTGAFFNDCNTGKRSITLNLGKPEGLELARRLIQDADMVTSNFTPGQMEKWGFGYEQLQALRPGIIVASLPVMGSEGPKRSWRGIGNSVVAMSGIAAHMGFPDRAPVGLGTLQTDFTVPLIGASAIMSALLHRERTGEGQYIEIAQYESALHLLDTELIEFLVNGDSAPRKGNRSRQSSPHGVFASSGDDRWLALEVRDTVEWLQLCAAIGRPDLATREELRSLSGRRGCEQEIEDAITAWTSQRTAFDGESVLQGLGIPAAALRNVADLVEDRPGLAEFFEVVDHPSGAAVMLQNQPFTWNGKRLQISRAPLLGEHNEQVFRGDLGIDEDTFVGLMVSEVIV